MEDGLLLMVKPVNGGKFPSRSGDWIDLYSRKNMEYKAGDIVDIPLGVAMKLPEGYEAHLLPRSSMMKKTGLIMRNSMGVIDNDYSGDEDEWIFPGVALKDGTVNQGQKICQFRLVKSCPKVYAVQCTHLGPENRGGLGSTGDY